MAPRRPRITHYTPLPPARNGIADYAWRMMDALKPYFDQEVMTSTADGRAPKGIAVRHSPTASEGVRVYQIGNNWFHTTELAKARTQPGVLVLHDLQLLYLYQSLGLKPEEKRSLLSRSAPLLSDRTIWDFEEGHSVGKLPYMLCGMTNELIDTSLQVIVHSRYAKMVLERNAGKTLDKVHVIPHFAMAAAPRNLADTRAKLGVGAHTQILLTSGFAAPNKRFDVIAESANQMVRNNPALIWVHAGNDRHDDFSLTELVSRYPDLRARFKATGYIDEEELDDWVAVSDIVLNLRFPSVGESSGSLARALSQGVCIVVTDTGSYAEIPDDSVLKISPLADANEMAQLLGGLLLSPEMRRTIGENAARYARETLAIEKYARDVRDVILMATAQLSDKPASRWWQRLLTPRGERRAA